MNLSKFIHPYALLGLIAMLSFSCLFGCGKKDSPAADEVTKKDILFSVEERNCPDEASTCKRSFDEVLSVTNKTRFADVFDIDEDDDDDDSFSSDLRDLVACSLLKEISDDDLECEDEDDDTDVVRSSYSVDIEIEYDSKRAEAYIIEFTADGSDYTLFFDDRDSSKKFYNSAGDLWIVIKPNARIDLYHDDGKLGEIKK